VIPLYGFLEGDTIGLLVLAHKEWHVRDLAEQLQISARLRVRHRRAVHVLHQGRVLDPGLTLEEVGIGPLDRFDVVEATP
jgi:hypothetical protein